MVYILVIACGTAALFTIFTAIRLEWPESYHTLGNASSADFAISAGPVRYLLFRLGPGFLVALFTTVTACRLGLDHPMVVGFTGVAVHTLLTNGRSAVAVWQRPTGTRRGPLLLMQLGVGCAALGTAGLAARISPHLERLVPDVDDLVSDVWTAGFAAVCAIAITRITSMDNDSFELALSRSYRQIDPQLFRLASEKAAQHSCDPRLIWTLMVVENLQRPRWFRKIEGWVGRFLPNRTTGLLQVIHASPLSDSESIELAIEKRFQHRTVPTTNYGSTDDEALAAVFMLHNPDSNFGALCVEAFFQLSEDFERDFAGSLHDLTMGEDSP